MESTDDDDDDDVQQEIWDEKSENMENNCWRFIFFFLSKVRLVRSATWDRYTNLLSNTIA